MGRCIIQTCRNFSHKTRTTDKSTKYHTFPKDVDMRFKWIKALQRSDNWVPDCNASVCSEHFLSTDFERDLKAELLKLPPKRILKPEAVPSVNLVPFEEDIASTEKKTIRIPLGENKENVTEANFQLNNGYIISYLGKPRLLITNTYTKIDGSNSFVAGYNNQSRIISLGQNQNINKSPFTPNDSLTLSANNINLLENKNVFKLDELCRLCGSYSNRMTSIFNDSKCNFSEFIEVHFPDIKVQENDILPTQICFKCETNLTTWYQFHKTCNSVNKRFQSILKKLVHEPDIQQKLAVKDITELPSENSKDRFPENMDEDLKYIFNDNDNDDVNEIEIVEVSPDLLDPLDSEEPKENSNITEVTETMLEKHDTLNDSETENVPTPSDLSLGIEESFRQEERTSKRRRRRQLSINALRMCHMCGKIFKYPESLRRHLKTVHSDERPFKCHLCTSSFNRNHNLTIHIKVVHQRQRLYAKKQVPRLCDYCGKVLLSSRSLEEHISSMHTKKALYECDRCQSTFYRKLSFEKHRSLSQCDIKTSKKSNGTKSAKSEEVFLKYCEICGLEFKKEHFYIKHKLKHMTTFSCPVCSVKFDDCSVLKNHLNAEHPEIAPFECETCGKKFKTKGLLNCHAIIHSGEKRYQCQYCSIKFLKKKYLTTHILTHTGERPFVCTICGKGFKQSGDMRKHKATHIRKQL